METLKLPSFKKNLLEIPYCVCGQTDEVELLEVAYNVCHREHLKVSDNMVFGDFTFTSYEGGKDDLEQLSFRTIILLEQWLGERNEKERGGKQSRGTICRS